MNLAENMKKTFKNAHIKARPNTDPGIWVSFLLPLSILITLTKDTHVLSHDYKLATIAAAGIITANIVLLIQGLKYGCLKIGIAHLASAIFTSFLFCTCLHKGIFFSACSGIFTTFAYYKGVPLLMKTLPKCFTFGEACLVIQSVIFFTFASAVNIFNATFQTPVKVQQISTLILQVGILGFGLISCCVYKKPFFRKPLPFYGLTIFVFVFVILLPLNFLIKQCALLWVLHLLTDRLRTISVLMFWVVCTALAVIVVNNQIQKGRKANTVIRKTFHILVVVVYVTGLIDQCSVLYLASGIVLVFFLALEALRILNLPPIGRYLQDGFFVFSDEKDAGILALTPVYLLAGCSLPLWLHPESCDVTDSAGFNLLPLMSGVLSTGIGDTFASSVGTWIGRHKWAGTKKTVEGTLACVFSQIAVVFLLVHTGYVVNNSTNIIRAVLAIILTSLIEAKTEQVDNIILPFVMYIILY